MSRKNQTSELKSRVMEVALGHFSEVGIERTNVSNILNDSGCSVGSLYHHFGNKEGIAEALFATALGLAAAIPAVIAYNKFAGDLERFGARLETFAQEFSTLLARQLDEGGK